MNARSSSAALFAVLLTAACSAATPAPDAPDAGPAGEQLLGQPPAGWRQVGATNLPSLRRAEFIPESEAEDAWTRRITFEAMVEDPLPDPIAFVDLLSEGRDRDCGTFERFPTFAGEENGYPTAVSLLICHKDRQTDQSEVTLMKTIQGNDAFYVITRGRRGPAIPAGEAPDLEEAEVGGWAVYLKSITVCDDTRAAHPCPAGD